MPATRFFKAKLKESEVTYFEQLHGNGGVNKTSSSGTFSAVFFLAGLAAMELEGVVLEEI
jgi:hypothetical protein